ncbi:MAG: 16S rRNA (adenine(1518)-N(6)/adenine(1519)-N(6))-dimethyltransferase RsmA [Patescibacteria group bacterium]
MTKLGQHFLTSKSVAAKMVKAADIDKNDFVLEIGPGKGILTGEILKKAKKTIAVEKDAELFNFLDRKFAEFIKAGRLILIHSDIRDFLKTGASKLKADKIVANIPYYLTGRLLRLLLNPSSKRSALKAELYVLMLQKEVSRRIMGRPKMNLLAVSVQVFAEPKIAFYLSKNYFRPRPKVDSAVIVLKKRVPDFFKENKISQKIFFNLVKTGFAHKRKTLSNNLKSYKLQAKSFDQCGISPTARAEDLTLENWACLTWESDSQVRKIKIVE